MNYCSIEDAWGKKNYMSNQLENYMDKLSNKENNDEPDHYIVPKKQNEMSKIQNNVYEGDMDVEHFTTNQQNIKKDCDSVLQHIKNCTYCQNKVRLYLKPRIIDNFQNLVDDNKDTIVLILVAISILLFFNLINNITKN